MHCQVRPTGWSVSCQLLKAQLDTHHLIKVTDKSIGLISISLSAFTSNTIKQNVSDLEMCNVAYHITNLFVTSKNETTNSPIHEFKVLHKCQ